MTAPLDPAGGAEDLHVPMAGVEPGSPQEQVHLRQLLRNAGRKLRRQSGILHLLYQVTRIANEAGDLEQALEASVPAICQLMGWSVGHVYRLAEVGDEMLPSPTWWMRDQERFAPFREITTRTRFPRGVGLVGQAWEVARPQWVEDVTRDPAFVRTKVGRNLGIRGALAVPVCAHDRVVAVLEFFSEQAEEVNEQLLQAMEQVGVQLGHVYERQQAAAEQGAVEQARASLAHILESTSDIVGTASLDGRLLFLNRAGREALGVPVEADLEGLTIADFHPPWAVRKIVEEGFPLALQGGVWHGETAMIGRVGKEIPVSQVVMANFDATGRLECVSTVARDISERKRSESTLLNQSIELHLANAQLERAARLKDEFLANMSHELRTPLNAILGLSEAMQEGVFGPLTTEQDASLGTIRDSGGHLLALINDILDLSKAEAGMLQLDLEPVNLVDVVRASLQFVRQAARTRKIRLSTRFPDTPTLVVGDARRLKQVTVNLLGNAVKFTPEGGCVTVEVEQDEDRQAVELSVRDTGIGIAAGDLDRLFQPFVQLHSGLARRYEGTGLGLSLVARMVELHGGSVSVDSRVGEGSCFSVLLPAPVQDPVRPEGSVPAPSEETGPSPGLGAFIPRQKGAAPAPPRELGGLRVLLVEDNELNVLTVQYYLEKKGCLVLVARDGVEGVRMAREAAPQVILMDIQMPRMDGLEAIRTIRQDLDLVGLPIIALTALATEEDRARCLDAGADRCLSKPAALSVLVTTMLEVLPPVSSPPAP